MRPSPPIRAASASPRRPIIAGREVEEGERDPLEEDLLKDLEGLAQKTDVLTNWADELYEYVRAVPQSEFFFWIFSLLSLSRNSSL
jgi:hypothetical protein